MKHMNLGCVALAACLCLSGCGGRNLNLVPVQGTATLDGEPLKNKSLLFTPAEGEGIPGSANTDANGKYELLAIVTGLTEAKKGVPPGRYKVTASEPAIPIEGGDEEIEGMILPGEAVASGIPQRYQSTDTTPLVVEVPEGGGTIDLELTSS
jgi:hypothetical protein